MISLIVLTRIEAEWGYDLTDSADSDRGRVGV